MVRVVIGGDCWVYFLVMFVRVDMDWLVLRGFLCVVEVLLGEMWVRVLLLVVVDG